MPENSAARVHALMSQAQHKNGNAYQVWSEVFGLTPPDQSQIPEVTTRLVAMYQELLLAEQEARLTMSPEKAAAKLQHFPRLKRALLSFNLNGNFDHIRDVMTDAALISLELLAHDLEEEPKKQPKEIEEINNQVNELFNVVSESKLNKKLKEFILTWLSKIRTALDRFRISGVRGLQEALATIQGEAAFFAPVVAEIKKEAPTVHERFLTMYAKAIEFADFADKCRKIAESPYVAPLLDFVAKSLGFDEFSKIGDGKGEG